MLPRRDRDAENRPFRTGMRPQRKGIGTHAPSEITYRLAGAYKRLRATAIAAGGSHSCLLQDANMYCWGTNFFGELALSTADFSGFFEIIDPALYPLAATSAEKSFWARL